MADRLASIYGTEKDKVNCSFYFKIGACRHGDRCSRKHVKPTFSQTVLLSNVYQNPAHSPNCTMTPKQLQEHFDDFYEDMFIELAKYGEIEKLNVCDNVGDHLVGNVYIRYRYEEDASKAVDALNDRFYGGRPLYAELSPVTDFGEACCRQYENMECVRDGFCNFMHLKSVTRKLKRELFAAQEKSLAMMRHSKRHSPVNGGESRRKRSRSRSPTKRDISHRTHRSSSSNHHDHHRKKEKYSNHDGDISNDSSPRSNSKYYSSKEDQKGDKTYRSSMENKSSTKVKTSPSIN